MKKKIVGAFCLAIACAGAMGYSVHFFQERMRGIRYQKHATKNNDMI